MQDSETSGLGNLASRAFKFKLFNSLEEFTVSSSGPGPASPSKLGARLRDVDSHRMPEPQTWMAAVAGGVGNSLQYLLGSTQAWAHYLLGAGSKLAALSPLAFSDALLERDFLKVQRSIGADLALMHSLLLLGFAGLMARLLPVSELSRALALGVVPCLSLALRAAFPAAFVAHVQAMNAITKLAVITIMLPTASLLLETRKEGPLTPVVFLHVYFMDTHVIGMAITHFGAWQAFLPNLATSLLIFALQVSSAPACCARWGPAADPDVVLLSLFPKTLNVLTANFAPTPALLWSSRPSPTCIRNVAALQLVGCFVVNFILLVCEGVHRRAFLKKNAGRLGRGGMARAAKWPFEGIRGFQLCIQIVASHLVGLCLVWQTLLAFVV
eukprot:jgi/Botrbrau1/20517/Bobra.145_2s0070.1